MSSIQTKDYLGKERRNGGKIRLSGGDYIKICSAILFILVTGVTFFINTNNVTSVLAKDSEENKKIDKKQDETITIMQGDIKYIRKDMSDMKQEQQIINEKIGEGNKLLYRILGKLENQDSTRLFEGYAGERPIIRRDE